MCHALILFASHPLPVVVLDDAVWLGVDPLPPQYDPVRAHVGEANHAYYVSSHSGCSCGFHSSEAFPGDDDSYDVESRRALADYLRDQIERRREVRLVLFDTWEGDFTAPDRRITVTLAAIAGTADPVPERTLAFVVDDGGEAGGRLDEDPRLQ